MKYNKKHSFVDKSDRVLNAGMVYNAKIDELRRGNEALKREIESIRRTQEESINKLPIQNNGKSDLFTSEDLDREISKAVNTALGEAEEEFRKILKSTKKGKVELFIKSPVIGSSKEDVSKYIEEISDIKGKLTNSIKEYELLSRENDILKKDIESQKDVFEHKIESLNSIIKTKEEMIDFLRNNSNSSNYSNNRVIHNKSNTVNTIGTSKPSIDNIIIDPIEDVNMDKFSIGRIEPEVYDDPVDIKEQVGKLRNLLR